MKHKFRLKGTTPKEINHCVELREEDLGSVGIYIDNEVVALIGGSDDDEFYVFEEDLKQLGLKLRSTYHQ